jgi:hypothetical protein
MRRLRVLIGSDVIHVRVGFPLENYEQCSNKNRCNKNKTRNHNMNYIKKIASTAADT